MAIIIFAGGVGSGWEPPPETSTSLPHANFSRKKSKIGTFSCVLKLPCVIVVGGGGTPHPFRSLRNAPRAFRRCAAQLVFRVRT